MDTIYSLHKFMLLTKGQEYLIAVAFLVLFALFFRWLNGKPHGKKVIK
jgi:hypothetical protein